MFDVGFSEMLVIAIVALIVLGPEKMPKVARFAGIWIRRARTQWNSVKEELNLELHEQELRRQLAEAKQALEAHTSALATQVNDAMATPPAKAAAGVAIASGADGPVMPFATSDRDNAIAEEDASMGSTREMAALEEDADYNPDAHEDGELDPAQDSEPNSSPH